MCTCGGLCSSFAKEKVKPTNYDYPGAGAYGLLIDSVVQNKSNLLLNIILWNTRTLHLLAIEQHVLDTIAGKQ